MRALSAPTPGLDTVNILLKIRDGGLNLQWRPFFSVFQLLYYILFDFETFFYQIFKSYSAPILSLG